MNITLFGGSFNPPHLGHLIVVHQTFELIPEMDQLWVLPAYRHTFQKNLAPPQHRLKLCKLLIKEVHPSNIQGASSGNNISPGLASNKSEGSQFSHHAHPKLYAKEGAAMARPTAWQFSQKTKDSHIEPSAAKKIAATQTQTIRLKLETLEIDQKLSGETYEALQLLKASYPKQHFSFLMGSDQLKSFKKWGSWRRLLQEMPFYIYPRAGYTNTIPFPNMTLLASPTQVITNISSTLIRGRIRQGLPIAHLVPSRVLKYLRIHKLY